ncbi:hypothetical protein Taro_029187 [Colocasia esculenta]|uniref:Uncharacterized protein n=1 Tax=Colocasia esculenta TaxID=4460 RepID=A0A843VZI8_COLES|nr:hypothetical protein [Colocasia esculenta]
MRRQWTHLTSRPVIAGFRHVCVASRVVVTTCRFYAVSDYGVLHTIVRLLSSGRARGGQRRRGGSRRLRS